MTVDSLIQKVTKYLRQGVLIALLFCVGVVVIKSLGVDIPVRAIDHVALAYLAGAYWLTK